MCPFSILCIFPHHSSLCKRVYTKTHTMGVHLGNFFISVIKNLHILQSIRGALRIFLVNKSFGITKMSGSIHERSFLALVEAIRMHIKDSAHISRLWCELSMDNLTKKLLLNDPIISFAYYSPLILHFTFVRMVFRFF